MLIKLQWECMLDHFKPSSEILTIFLISLTVNYWSYYSPLFVVHNEYQQYVDHDSWQHILLCAWFSWSCEHRRGQMAAHMTLNKCKYMLNHIIWPNHWNTGEKMSLAHEPQWTVTAYHYVISQISHLYEITNFCQSCQLWLVSYLLHFKGKYKILNTKGFFGDASEGIHR